MHREGYWCRHHLESPEERLGLPGMAQLHSVQRPATWRRNTHYVHVFYEVGSPKASATTTRIIPYRHLKFKVYTGGPRSVDIRVTTTTHHPMVGRSSVQPTDIKHPDYFHKVVDCQWACPAHTPVPEYIRLIAAGPLRATPTWSTGSPTSSPASSGAPATVLRARVPARPRRGEQRREARAGRDLPPEARRRRLQGRHPRSACRSRASKNGKRIACVGAGPASLTVARDLAPLGYHVTVFDADHTRRRHDPHADPALPPARGGHRRGGRLHPRPRRRVHAAASASIR